MEGVAVLDAGTTSTRALVFDARGKVAAGAALELALRTPTPGRAEQDPREIEAKSRRVLRRALAEARRRGVRVRALGLTNQRETFLLWEPGGRPRTRAVVWQDRRSAGFCAAMPSRRREWVRRRSGLPVDPYFSATKLALLLRDADLRRDARRGRLRFGTVDAWLLDRLAGLHATEPSNGSRTLLLNLRTRRWDHGLLDLFGVPEDLLPEVRPSTGPFGEVGGVPVAAVLGDQQASLFGHGCWRPGEAECTYGTGAFLLANTGPKPKPVPGLAASVAWERPGRPAYCLEASIFTAGDALRWLRDNVGLLEAAGQSERVARQVPDSGEVLFVPALSGLGAPHWDPEARGALLGLSRATARGQIVRAVLEGVAHRVADGAEVMGRAVPLRSLRAGGGGSRNALWMQMQADILGVPVLRSAEAEATALGVGLLAGLEAGMWDAGEARNRVRAERGFRPRRGFPRARERARWRRALEVVRAWRGDG
ncbi:MAG: FGGY-family carbohydrate kinase [Halobacteria archaeon]